MIWIEFYTLSQDRGITFPAYATNRCGDVLRIQIPKYPNQPLAEADWYWVTIGVDKYAGDCWFADGWWTDFGVTSECFDHFDVWTAKKAIKYGKLVRQ